MKIKNPIIIGHSFGGKVALAYGTKHKTNKLVLLASPYRKKIQKESLKLAYELRNINSVSKFENILSTVSSNIETNMTPEQIKKAGFSEYFVNHTAGIWPGDATGVPFTSAYFQSKGDPITDLNEDLAAEQKARTTYDNILRLVDDPDVRDPIKFLREREIVHFQRFGEGLRMYQDQLDEKNFYAFNPSFD